jgi:hypothetical protein
MQSAAGKAAKSWMVQTWAPQPASGRSNFQRGEWEARFMGSTSDELIADIC